MGGLLESVRVVDLSRLLPGAIATRRLADLGADVVKVEEPVAGDYLRMIPPLFNGGEGYMHRLLNRGKRSVALNPADPGDQELLLELCERADVVVEGSRPGRLEALGLSFDVLRSRRPSLVLSSVTGFGQTGPWASLPSHGMNMDALAGCLPIEHYDGRRGISRSAFAGLGVEFGGLNAALAIVAAVLRARGTGEGAWIDTSCWDSAVEINRLDISHTLTSSSGAPRVADLGPLYDVYETNDRFLVLFCAIEKKFWERFCKETGHDDLIPRWSGGGASVDFGNDTGLRERLSEIFRSASAREWQRRFVEWDVPGSVVLDVPEVVESEHFRDREMATLEEDGFVSVLGPVRYTMAGQKHPVRAGSHLVRAPRLGEHTDEVVEEWLGPTPKRREGTPSAEADRCGIQKARTEC